MPKYKVSAEIELNFDPLYADDEQMASDSIETRLNKMLESWDVRLSTEYTQVNITNVEEEDE